MHNLLRGGGLLFLMFILMGCQQITDTLSNLNNPFEASADEFSEGGLEKNEVLNDLLASSKSNSILGKVETLLLEEYPNDFGGIYLDVESATYHIAIVEHKDDIEDMILNNFSLDEFNNQLIFERVEYSFVELNQAFELIKKLKDSNEVDYAFSGIDVAKNRVTVGLSMYNNDEQEYVKSLFENPGILDFND